VPVEVVEPPVLPEVDPPVEPKLLPERPLHGATVADVADELPLCEISTPATLQFSGTCWVMISTKLSGPAEDEVVLVVELELPVALVLAGRMSMKATDSPVLAMLRKLPVTGITAAPVAPADELEVVGAPLAELLVSAPLEAVPEVPVVLVEPVVLPLAPALLVPLVPVPVKKEPVHWFCVNACW